MSGSRQISVVLAAMLLPLTAASVPSDAGYTEPSGIVDCLLPGQIRRIGGSIYQLPQRPARLPVSECGVRGGDFLLYDRANYETSLQHWKSLAESDGDADAMLYVAEIYEQGIGRDPDYAAAAKWYRKSADAGNTTAMISLAHLYKTGQGVPLDLEAAQSLYSQAFGTDIAIPLDPRSVAGADQRIETLMSQVDQIRKDKIAVELELDATNEQLDEARQALDAAMAGNGENAAVIASLQASITEQQREIDRYKDLLEATSSENAELTALRQQVEDQQAEMADLRDRLASSEAAVESSRSALQRQQSLLEETQSEFNQELAKSTVDADALKELSLELETQRGRIGDLEDELRKAEADKVLYQALADEASTKEDRIAALNARISVLEQQHNSIATDLDGERGKLAAASQELDAQVAEAAAAAQLSETEIAARDTEIARLRGIVARAEEESARHRDDIEHLSQQSEELQALRQELEREQAQSNRLQKLLTETQNQYTESIAEIEQANEQRALLTSEIDELRAAAASGDEASQLALEQRERELESAHAGIEALQAELAKSENELTRFKLQMSDTATRQSAAIENLRAAVEQSRTERARLEDKLASASQQLKAAENDLTVERTRVENLQDELLAARNENTANADTLARAQADLDSQSKQLEARQKEIERLHEQRRRYVAQIDELEQALAAKKVEFVGPRIVMLEPSESQLEDLKQETRGSNDEEGGVAIIPTAQPNVTRMVKGRVEAPAGLAKLTLDGVPIIFDDRNSFDIPLDIGDQSRAVTIVAVDHNGKEDTEKFEYRIEGDSGSARTVYNKRDRFEQDRNDALDHLKYYALLIANQDYESDFVRDLETPISDVEAIGKVLRERYNFEVDILVNADKDKIEEEFERIFYQEEYDDDKSNDRDAILIYYAGHGFGSDSRNNDAYFWAPVDAEMNSPRTWYKTRELESYLQVSSTNQIMVVADSCFAGRVLSRDGIPQDHASINSRQWRRFLTEYTEQKKSRYVLTSGGFAPVLDGGGGNHSVFARAFLNVLRQNNGIISAAGVHEQVAPVVMELAEQQNFEQTPFFGYLRSAGHSFGNFYFPAPQYAADSDEVTKTASIQISYPAIKHQATIAPAP